MSGRVFVFFDIGDTLASPVASPAGGLAGLDAYPFVPEVLARLGAATGGDDGDDGDDDVALGLISNTGDETAASMRGLLDRAGLLDAFAPHLLLFSSVEGLDKSQKAFFDLAAERAGADASQCVFVGESQAERAVAASAGFHVSPHPLHAFHLLKREFSVQ